MTTMNMLMTAMAMVAAANSWRPSQGRRSVLNATTGDGFKYRPLSMYLLSPVLYPRDLKSDKDNEEDNAEKEDFPVHFLQGYVKLIVLLFF